MSPQLAEDLHNMYQKFTRRKFGAKLCIAVMYHIGCVHLSDKYLVAALLL